MVIKKTFTFLLPFFIMLGTGSNSYGQLAEMAIPETIQREKVPGAFLLVVNEDTLVQFHTTQVFPLASTCKLIIAVEFARQAALGYLDYKTKVSLKEVDRFYIPGTDGGAHEMWKNDASTLGYIVNNELSLYEIAGGMMDYSSNACAEYFMHILSLDSINQTLKNLQLTSHTALYPFSSALMIASEAKKPGDKKFLKKIRNMKDQEYQKKAKEWHEKLWKDSTLAAKLTFEYLPLEYQQIWSDRLPAAHASDYGKLMQMINEGKIIDAETQRLLELTVGGLINYSSASHHLKKAGTKGGSTAFVLNQALYATTTEGEKIVMVYFINGLNLDQTLGLMYTMTHFEDQVLLSPEFREKVKKLFLGIASE